MKATHRLTLIALLLAMAACKPPPTDADMARAMPEDEPVYASDPLPSPETEGAMWAYSSQQESRIVYGIPGEPALIALDCLAPGLHQSFPALQITRMSPADQGASALLAMVGNGHIGRIGVVADPMGGSFVWKGHSPAEDLVWEALAGPRALGITVPGAGRVEMNPSQVPGEFIEACRAS